MSASMRVMIDTTYAARAPLSGTGIYIAQLVRALRELDGVEVVEAAFDERPAPGGGGVSSLRNLVLDTRWSARELPRRAGEAGVDVLHHPLPGALRLGSVPQVVTILDLAFERMPGAFDRGYRMWAHRVHRAAARRADAVVAISETTAGDVRELWGVPDERIVVAPLGPGQLGSGAASGGEPRSGGGDPGPGGRTGSGSIDPPYLLYVGDAEPRKDLPTLLAAYRHLRAGALQAGPDLVLAGAVGSAVAPGPGVRVVAAPSADALLALYRGALALVHPSRHEGFGLTLLEAMTLGVPVVAARSAAAAELCAGAARLVRPGDVRSLHGALEEVTRDPELRERMAAEGRLRAAAFAWERCARRHLAAYSLAVRERADASRSSL